MAIVFGLAAALLWGLSDYLSGFSARALGTWRSIFYGQAPGVILYTLWIAASPSARSKAETAPATFIGLALFAAVLNSASGYALTRGLIAGSISLIVPIATSYGAISSILAIGTGERLSIDVAIGIAITIVGVIAASIGNGNVKTTKGNVSNLASGVGWALLSAFGYGCTLWLQGRYVIPHIGPQATLWVASCVGFIVTTLLSKIWRISLAPPPRSIIGVTIGYGCLSTAAFFFLTLGLATGQVAVVAVLSSLSSAVTAVLGFALLAERMILRQWGGIVLILMGVALINIG